MKYKLSIGSCRFRSGAITVLIFILLLLQTAYAKIVFNSSRSDGSTHQLYVMEDNGRNVHRLTHSEFYDKNPRWFPDGKQILFERGLTKEAANVFGAKFYILSVKGDPELHRVPHTHPTDTFPAVSPDGKQIAFHSFRTGGWEIYVMDLDGTNLIRLTNNGRSRQIDYSPTSNQLAYKSGEDILVMKADGTEKEWLRPRPPPNFFFGPPTWSPSGTYVMYSETHRKDNGEWRIVAVRLIVQNGFTKQREQHHFGNKALIAAHCWMGNDRTVLLSMKADLDAPTSNYEIYRYSLDSRKLTNLTNHPADDYHPHWSPGFLSVFPLDKLTIQWGHLKQMD